MTHPLDTHIEKVNTRLKAARLGLKIERRGDMLALRGTLPPRPGSDRHRSHQQRIPLKLPANKTALKQAEQEAKVIAAKLIEQTFDWRPYLVQKGQVLGSDELVDKIAAFQEQYLQTGMADPDKHPASVKTTWDKAYAPYLRKLQDICDRRSTLSLPEAIVATVKNTRANSRSRQVCCTALDAFATFLELELPIDLKTLWGKYGSSRTQMRQLPTDQQIIDGFHRIPNPAWQFVYGMMAVYGLRNHEVFFCNYGSLINGDPEAAIEVLETTKTGSHDVWPFPPQWIEDFGLREVILPEIETDLGKTTLQRIGQQVTLQFRRYDIPFSPYDLRHAWAVRTILIGLPDTVAARMMGHSVAIHNRTYHRWITRRDQQKAVRAALKS
ncbi:site-specific integrase [Oscillatoria sp. CS-180]|uniref:site-specific integrase n=1 Tax=Oscillatoria sp. CS-180 TaxID=3021720 RepID=UPI00232F22CF|nr:site-specific integrase [Oscillatoria sp. CS-180]MDB9529272.1 site-specific integrase [Oscillatoria sp. CS-180]